MSKAASSLHVAVTLFAEGPASLPVYLSLNDERLRLDCGVGAGETVVRHVFFVENPEALVAGR